LILILSLVSKKWRLYWRIPDTV